MAKFLDAGSLMEEFKKLEIMVYNDETFLAYADVLAMLQTAETVSDVRTERHGHWKPIFDTEGNKRLGRAMHYECSRCGRTVKDETYSYSLDYEICPHCGAEMDEEEEW